MSTRRHWRTCVAVLAIALMMPHPASAQQSSPPPETAAKIRALGPVINPAGTNQIYAEYRAHEPTEGVIRTQDVAYGPAERNVLDIYKPVAATGAVPVVIFFHGGGFVRGDKRDRANVGYFFARNGVIALIANYRLAPQSKWPSGAEDVIAALRWTKTNVAGLGGDPKKIVLAGESAGAAHVALASFVSRFHGGKPLGAAGIVLQSGVYNVALETAASRQFKMPSPNPNDAYFGTDPSHFAAMSTVRLIDAPKTPTMIVYAEYDPAQMQIQAGELFATLCDMAGTCPELLRASGHGHISQVAAYNTDDTSVSAPVLAFIKAR